jgi:aspartate kinase
MENISILKFGGTTISTLSKIDNIANNIKNYFLNKTNKLIIVVSAMGNETDKLIELAASIDSCGYYKELDQLLCTAELKATALFTMSLLNKNINASSLSFNKLGIITDNNYHDAKIKKIDLNNIVSIFNTKSNKLDLSSANINVLVVPGFQGISELGYVTTLGRGGSDITAIALSSELNAKETILFKDVGAIYDDDPKINIKALKHETLSFEELSSIIKNGSKVINNRALDLAIKNNITIKIADPVSFKIGTVIGG